ncbi:MAG: hypothetical protein MMC33_002931 [Icmadophila ericetorum]|nr:hypothetical protein [Icmadophila ericetorum]
MVLQLSPEDYMDDSDVASYLSRLSSKKPPSSPQSIRLEVEPSQRGDPPLRSLRVAIQSYIHRNINIRSNITVELDDGIHFMRVVEVIQNKETGDVSVRGWIFRRAAFMDGLVEKKSNEVCWILEVEENDRRDLKEHAIQEIDVTRVVRRRTMKLTNLPYPLLSFREEPTGDSMEVIKSRGVLVCRWKYVTTYATAEARKKESYSEKALLRLSEQECDKCTMGDAAIREEWRGPTVKGGASFGVKPQESVHLKQELEREEEARSIIQQASQNQSTSPSEDSQESYCIDILSDDDDEICEVRYLSTNPVPDTQGPESRSSHISPPRRRARSLKAPEREVQSSTSPGGIVSDKHRTSLTPSRRSPNFVDLSLEDEKDGDRSNHSLGSPPKKPRISMHRVDIPLRRILPLDTQATSVERPEIRPKRHALNISIDDDDKNPGISKRRATSIIPIDDGKSHTDFPRKRSVIFISDDESKGRLTTPKSCQSAIESRSNSKEFGQRYTFGDAFCGAGGTSRGACLAGLRVQWGLDHNENACRSWEWNFPFADILNRDIFEVITRESGLGKVDILHLSPPCQFFSPAHTTAGQNDDANTAASFAIAGMLKCAKPRIVTLENTSGLLRIHQVWLYAVIHQFTSLGFSIRWKLLCFQDYGLGQRRERLIIIAACPGEPLPAFPPRTHSSSPSTTGLLPHTTMSHALQNIPPTWNNHNPSSLPAKDLPPQTKYANGLSKCMTTSGAGIVHPSGKRALTDREFACLQGFPLCHVFSEREVKRQIGNAVSPPFARVLFGHVRRELERVDGVPSRRGSRQREGDDVIDLSEV